MKAKSGWTPPTFNEELYRRVWKALKEGEERFMANKLEGGISRDLSNCPLRSIAMSSKGAGPSVTQASGQSSSLARIYLVELTSFSHTPFF